MADKLSIGEYMDMGLKDELIPMNNPECTDCNECCSMGTLLTDEEYERLKKFLKKDKYGKFLYQQGVSLVLRYYKQHKTIYWVCPFSHQKRCRIYNQRPEICRQFHCDEADKSKEFRNKYPRGSHMIMELFKKDTFDVIGREMKKGNARN